jgi:deoxyadenosine/deoxycytidine kinase
VTSPSPLLELVGVAGTGKTTLLETLKRRDPTLLTAVSVGSFRRLSLLIRHTARFLPAFLSQAPRGRWFTWHELRLMGYLEGWPRRVSPGMASSAVVLDHGPIFQLVQLREFGPPLVAGPAFAGWWKAARRAWARALDLVVFLDAPDAVLLPRIAGRAQRHVVKHLPAATASEVLAKYRGGYRALLGQMAGEGHFRVLRFDTSQGAPEEIADAVLVAVREAPASGKDPARAPESLS